MKKPWQHWRINALVVLVLQVIWLMGLAWWPMYGLGTISLLVWYIWRYSKVNMDWFHLHARSLIIFLTNIHFRKKIWILLGYKLLLDICFGWIAVNFSASSQLAIGIVTFLHFAGDSLILLNSTEFLERNYYVLSYMHALMLVLNFFALTVVITAVYLVQYWDLPMMTLVGITAGANALLFAFYLLSVFEHRWSALWIVLFGIAAAIMWYMGFDHWFEVKPLLWLAPLLVYTYIIVALDIWYHYHKRLFYLLESTAILLLALVVLVV